MIADDDDAFFIEAKATFAYTTLNVFAYLTSTA